jgi:hypothetical protein
VGEQLSHIKTKRKRWYDDTIYKDKSKPPIEAPRWAISIGYVSEDEGGKKNVATFTQKE